MTREDCLWTMKRSRDGDLPFRNMYGTELDLRKMESFIFMGYNVSPHVNAVWWCMKYGLACQSTLTHHVRDLGRSRSRLDRYSSDTRRPPTKCGAHECVDYHMGSFWKKFTYFKSQVSQLTQSKPSLFITLYTLY